MSEHTPLWSEERLGTRFKEILQHDILNRPLGTMRSDGQLHVQLMREVRDDYEAKLTELATLRARNEELETQLAAAQEWIPIEPGLHFIEGNNDTALLVSLDGSLLTIHATDDSMHHALSIQLSPKQYRLCRKQGGDA
jgi:hypothetical protein